MTDKINKHPLIGVGVLVWREKKILLGQRLATITASSPQIGRA